MQYSKKGHEDYYIKFGYEDVFDTNAIPPMTGICFFGVPIVFIHDPALLEDIYVKQNKFYSKFRLMRQKS